MLLLVVALIATMVLVGLVRGGSSGAGAKDVARSYLTAVAQGRASTALGYLTETPASDPLLTDRTLKRSREIAPMTHIQVLGVSGDSYYPTVAAAYMIGARRVTTNLLMAQDADGHYTVSSGLARLNATALAGLDLTVNGAAISVPKGGLQVFPGAYHLAVTTPSFALDGNGDVVLAGPDDYSSFDALKPKLTDEGIARVQKLVSDAVRTCLAQKTLKAGCGLSLSSPLSDGATVEQGSVRRAFTPELKAKLSHLEPDLDIETPTLVSASVDESADATVVGTTTSGQHARFPLLFGPPLGRAYVDLSAKKPDVNWR